VCVCGTCRRQRIIEHQIGDLTMRLVDLELKRIDERLKAESGKQVTQRMVMMTRKQDRLLYVCLYLLLNLAEDVSIERKMKKRGIVSYLTKVRASGDRALGVWWESREQGGYRAWLGSVQACCISFFLFGMCQPWCGGRETEMMRGGSVYVRRQGKHTRVHLLSGLPTCKKRGF